MASNKAVVAESLEGRLPSLVCKQKSVTDVSEGPKAISWLSTTGKPADFCRRLQQLQGDGQRQTIPPLDQLRAIGGIIAHLEMVTYESGLIAATVHAETHDSVLYNGQITECRGMKGNEPDIGYPLKLKDLMVDGFELQVRPAA